MKTNEILSEIFQYYPEMRYQKTRLDELKEFLKAGFEGLKADALEEGKEFEYLNINGIYVRERVRKNFSWSKDFTQELIDLGKAHLVLKKADKLDKRFNLSEFELEKREENQRIICSLRRSSEETHVENTKLEQEKNIWHATSYEELVETYMRYKKKVDLKLSQYNIDKNLLLNLMKEEGLQKVTGFSVADEMTQYDFRNMYGVSLEEKVQIATNGEQSIDLLTDKPILLTPNALDNAEKVKKRFQKPRLEKLREHLGDDYYFVEGYRVEDDILSRFSVSTSKVEEAIDNGHIDPSVLKTQRAIESEDDIKLVFEIISEQVDKKRRETGYQMFMDKAVERSLRMEEEKRRIFDLEKQLK